MHINHIMNKIQMAWRTALFSSISGCRHEMIRNLVECAVRSNGLALEHVPMSFKEDKEIVLLAVGNNAEAIVHASEELQEDEEVMKTMVAQCGLVLAELPESARESRDIVEIAVRQDGLALEYASEELQDDSCLVLIAVEQNGMALEFASEVVQNEREVVMSAVSRDGLCLVHAGEDRREEKDITLAAVGNAGMSIQYTSIELQKDIEVMKAAVSNDGMSLEYIVEHLEEYIDEDDSQDARESYLEIIITAIKNNGEALKFVDIQSESYQRRYLYPYTQHACLFIFLRYNLFQIHHFTFFVLFEFVWKFVWNSLSRISIWLHVSDLHHMFALTGPHPYSVDMPAKPDKDSVLQLHNIDLRIPEQHLNVTFNSSPDGRRVPRRSFSESALESCGW